MSNLSPAEQIKRKREVIFVGGVKVIGAEVFDPSIASTEDIVHFFGQDRPTVSNIVDNAVTAITVRSRRGVNDMLNQITWQDKDDGSKKAYRYEENLKSNVVHVNRLNEARDSYDFSQLISFWVPTPGLTAGAPNDFASRAYAGNAASVEEFEYPILSEKIALVSGTGEYTGQISRKTAMEVPGKAGIYAVVVHAIKETRAGQVLQSFEKEDLEITAAMVSVGGVITIPQSAMDSLDVPTKACVWYLYNNTGGVHPAVVMDNEYGNLP